jgi:hypothetical protein
MGFEEFVFRVFRNFALTKSDVAMGELQRKTFQYPPQKLNEFQRWFPLLRLWKHYFITATNAIKTAEDFPFLEQLVADVP